MAVVARGIAAVAQRGKRPRGGHIAAWAIFPVTRVVLDPGPDVGVDALNRGGIRNEAQPQGDAGGIRGTGAGSSTGDAEHARVIPGSAKQAEDLEDVSRPDEAVAVRVRIVGPLGLGHAGTGEEARRMPPWTRSGRIGSY